MVPVTCISEVSDVYPEVKRRLIERVFTVETTNIETTAEIAALGLVGISKSMM